MPIDTIIGIRNRIGSFSYCHPSIQCSLTKCIHLTIRWYIHKGYNIALFNNGGNRIYNFTLFHGSAIGCLIDDIGYRRSTIYNFLCSSIIHYYIICRYWTTNRIHITCIGSSTIQYGSRCIDDNRIGMLTGLACLISNRNGIRSLCRLASLCADCCRIDILIHLTCTRSNRNRGGSLNDLTCLISHRHCIHAL